MSDDDHGSGDHDDGDSGSGGHGDGNPAGAVGGIAGGAAGILGAIGGAMGDDEHGDDEHGDDEHGDDEHGDEEEDKTKKDVKTAIKTAEKAAKAVEKGAKTAEKLKKGIKGIQEGNVGDAAGGLGGALENAGAGVGTITGGISGLLNEDEGELREGLATAGTVANTVGQVARGLAEVIEGGEELLGGLLGDERQGVHYHLEVQGLDSHWAVSSVSLSESLGSLSTGLITASVPGSEHLEESELLAKDIGLVIERGDERRSFRGIVRHAGLRRADERLHVNFDVAPALWLAAETQDSRIYQRITVPKLVDEIVEELVGNRQRGTRHELTDEANYLKHEYLVQHRESHWEFLKRICEEEGIFLYFDHDEEEREILVLGDSNDNRPRVRPDHDGIIEYEENDNQAEGREVATGVHRHHRVSATDAVVRGYDWTNPGLAVHHERVERGEWEGPRLEHYHHDNAVRHHEYDEGAGNYQQHTADRYSRFHTERLDIQRQMVTIETTVVSAMPGHTFELQGADLHDNNYLIISATSGGSAGSHSGGSSGGHGGSYHNTLVCIPKSVPYRPPEPVRRMMPGPETATVVGPAGEEIHTDKHGRIKVQFHWDRQGQNDEHSSAWIRVNYGWSGPGWGQIFIPRIGMEVIVSFLGGDPDRPMAMGAVYNGQNPPPYELPEHKTKSTIKTNSSLGGGGYNELRFEDKKGEEEVWIHAEKDFNEVVEHDHTTHVKNCQTNTVDVDQTETVGNDQTLTVHNNREKTVDKDETIVVKMNRSTYIGPDGGDETLVVENNRIERVATGDDDLYVNAGNKSTTVVAGKWDVSTKQRFQLMQNDVNHFEIKDSAYLNVVDRIQLKAGDGAVHYDAMPDGTLKVKSDANTEFKATADYIVEAENIKLKANTNIELEAGTEIVLKVGSSTITISGSEINIEGGVVKVSASSGNTEITAAGQVKLKS